MVSRGRVPVRPARAGGYGPKSFDVPLVVMTLQGALETLNGFFGEYWIITHPEVMDYTLEIPDTVHHVALRPMAGAFGIEAGPHLGIRMGKPGPCHVEEIFGDKRELLDHQSLECGPLYSAPGSLVAGSYHPYILDNGEWIVHPYHDPRTEPNTCLLYTSPSPRD